MTLFEVLWSSGSMSGTLQVWAPDSDTALATVRENPSLFGIPYEDPIVGAPSWLRGERRRHVRD